MSSACGHAAFRKGVEAVVDACEQALRIATTSQYALSPLDVQGKEARWEVQMELEAGGLKASVLHTFFLSFTLFARPSHYSRTNNKDTILLIASPRSTPQPPDSMLFSLPSCFI